MRGAHVHVRPCAYASCSGMDRVFLQRTVNRRIYAGRPPWLSDGRHTDRPVEKPYQDYTFALRLNHLRSMKTIFNSSRRTTFLDCALLGEDSHDTPPYTKMGEASQRQIFTWPLSSNGWKDPSIWHLLVDHLELEPHHLTPSFMSIPWDHMIPHGTLLALCVDQLAQSFDQHIIFFFP